MNNFSRNKNSTWFVEKVWRAQNSFGKRWASGNQSSFYSQNFKSYVSVECIEPPLGPSADWWFCTSVDKLIVFQACEPPIQLEPVDLSLKRRSPTPRRRSRYAGESDIFSPTNNVLTQYPSISHLHRSIGGCNTLGLQPLKTVFVSRRIWWFSLIWTNTKLNPVREYGIQFRVCRAPAMYS